MKNFNAQPQHSFVDDNQYKPELTLVGSQPEVDGPLPPVNTCEEQLADVIPIGINQQANNKETPLPAIATLKLWTPQQEAEKHRKRTNISRNLFVMDGNFYVPRKSIDPVEIEILRNGNPGAILQRDQAYGLEIQSRMIASAFETNTAEYLVAAARNGVKTAAFLERYGTGQGTEPDNNTMRSPQDMPLEIIDPTHRMTEGKLRWLIAMELALKSDLALRQSIIINEFGVESADLSLEIHRGLGKISTMMSAWLHRGSVLRYSTKKDRAKALLEAEMEGDEHAQLIHLQTNQHATSAAYGDRRSLTVNDLENRAPTRSVASTIDIAYELPKQRMTQSQ